MPEPDPVKLSPDDMLIAEFNYIAQTAFQANEDRARVASFYVVSVGSFIAAILGTQFLTEKFDPRTANIAFAGLFFLLTGMGTLTIIQLSRLRSAWHESAIAMNQIKEYYIANLNESNLDQAIRWRVETLPDKYKRNSIAYLLAIQVALLSALTFGAATFFLLQGSNAGVFWLWSSTITFSVIAYFVQMYVFGKPLKKK